MQIRLFIKSGCPWCDEAIEWLTSHGISFATLDVNRDASARAEMLELIEVQSGDYLGEDDIVRYEDVYGRA